MLNSAGIERFPDAQFDMVRLGIGLHGIGAHASLKVVSSIKTTISQVRNLAAGETVKAIAEVLGVERTYLGRDLRRRGIDVQGLKRSRAGRKRRRMG